MNPNFLTTLKPLFTPTQTQIDSLAALFASMDKHGVIMPEQRAYIFATAYHESRFKAVEENGKGKGRPYGSHIDLVNDRHVVYLTPDQLYYGRGLVQLTWKSNYAAFGRLLGIDLVNHPELALVTSNAAEIMVIGMQKGMFTGVSLNHYFNNIHHDALGARAIINGKDKAELIKGYYDLFLKALKS